MMLTVEISAGEGDEAGSDGVSIERTAQGAPGDGEEAAEASQNDGLHGESQEGGGGAAD